MTSEDMNDRASSEPGMSEASDADPLEGSDSSSTQKFAGRYELRKAIGSGARGQVYLAHDPLLDSFVAIKMLHHSGSDDAVVRFQNEAIATGKLKNERIAQTLDFGQSDGLLYMVMEYVDGESLAALLDRQTSLPPARALPLFLDIAQALVHAHGNGILHRDLKPANVIVVQSGEGESAKLVDFGIAKIQGATKTITDPSAIVGSPVYMSPEQCKSQQADARSDIYSFGCLMFETLSGQPPIVGDTVLDTIGKKSNQEPPSLSTVMDTTKMPDGLARIVDTCLRLKPEERFQNVSAVLQALEELTIEEEAPTLVPEVSPKRLSRMAILAVIAVPLVIGAAVVEMNATMAGKNLVNGQLDPVKHLQLSVGGFNSDDLTAAKPQLPVLVKEAVPTAGHESGSFVLQLQEQLPEKFGSNATPSFKVNRDFPHVISTARMTQDEDFKLLVGQTQYTSLSIEHAGLVKGDGLKYIEKLPLKTLAINETNILDSALIHVSKISGLEKLYLHSASNITDQGLAYLEGMKKLNTVHVMSHHITNKGVKSLSKIKSIESLAVMRAMLVTDDCIPSLCSLPSLNTLMLNYTGVTGKGIIELAQCKKELVHLEISGLPFTDASLDALKTMPHLRVLHMEDTEISDKDLPRLAALKDLSTLFLEASHLSGNSIGALQHNQMEYLLLRAPVISTDMLKAISTLNVEILELRKPSKLYDSQLRILVSMPRLKHLTIADCNSKDVTRKGLEDFQRSYFQRWKRMCEIGYASRDMPFP